MTPRFIVIAFERKIYELPGLFPGRGRVFAPAPYNICHMCDAQFGDGLSVVRLYFEGLAEGLLRTLVVIPSEAVQELHAPQKVVQRLQIAGAGRRSPVLPRLAQSPAIAGGQ